MSAGLKVPGGISDIPLDVNLRRPRSVVNPTAPQAEASPVEKKNAGDNAGEECPGCENNIQTD